MALTSKSFSELITFTRASTATRINALGLIESVAANKPRFDYDPVTLEAKGFLIEEQRTNALLHSADFSNVAWEKAGSGVTANAATAPDGTMSADLVSYVLGGSRVVQQIVATATRYTGSIFVKLAGADNGVQLLLFNATTATTIAQTSFLSVSLGEAAGNGWFRFTISASAGITAGNLLQFYTYTDAAGGAVAGSNLYMWGAQMEVGDFVTSHIPTAAAAVTRQADRAIITGTAFSDWFSQPQGTFAVTFMGGRESQQNGFGRVLGYGAGATFLARSGGAEVVTFNGTGAASKAGLPVDPANGFVTAGVAWDGTLVAVTAAGLVPTLNATAIPSATASMALGQNGDSPTNMLNGHIRSIRFWPFRVSDAELQELTA